MRKLDLIGKKFGRLTVTEEAPPIMDRTRKRRAYVCTCDCGAVKTLRAGSLRSGLTTSCGCFRRESFRRVITKHGLRANKPEYNAWMAMRSRCLCPTNDAFESYGGRGISVCERWDKFENFLADMGKRPSSKLSLDRINNDLGYGPHNCRWADRLTQNNNRRPRRRCKKPQQLPVKSS